MTSSLAEIRSAYRLMNLGELSSPEVIERAYEELSKRWNPDQYPNGSNEHTHASERLKSINDAYDLIAGAPLRSPIQRFGAEKPIGSDLPLAPDGNDVKPGPTDAFAFCVRFVCGALLGVLIAARLFFSTWISIEVNSRRHWSLAEVFGVAGIVLVCGFLAGRYGDAFWFQTLGRDGLVKGRFWYR